MAMAQDDVLLDVRAEELRQEKKKLWAGAFAVIAFLFTVFQLYTAGAGPYIALVQRSVHVCFAVVLCAMAHRMKMEKAGRQPLAAYLLNRRAEKRGRDNVISPGEAIKIGVLVFGLLRAISSLGDDD